MRNIPQGRGRGASRLNLGTSYAPSRVNDPEVVRSVLQMLTDGASGKDTAALCGVSTRTVSRIRAREAERGAKTGARPRGKRSKYERPYTREQRAKKKGLVRR
jgi:hypothetical protein